MHVVHNIAVFPPYVQYQIVVFQIKSASSNVIISCITSFWLFHLATLNNFSKKKTDGEQLTWQGALQLWRSTLIMQCHAERTLYVGRVIVQDAPIVVYLCHIRYVRTDEGLIVPILILRWPGKLWMKGTFCNFDHESNVMTNESYILRRMKLNKRLQTPLNLFNFYLRFSLNISLKRLIKQFWPLLFWFLK